ncbi:TetR/AcrR family transcriptional regulator [Aureimonas leprariae]|uniref:TetR/AcrR family transcriptional regulator n=1 Tax=Plantimonas leprariae TaxID=2615207 RepID=A0A7V7TW42_9HYPH|nr:TetR/AcrR family transcriptional regulator [Aureimonas leprariae]KAB0679023.1 TetR/AcrR family transcriptional regulator [Aureimonas leprariae]
MPGADRKSPRESVARSKVLDAAERLLRADPGATFSMRDLAAEAGVSFATPFNQFGSKTAIAQALSSRRIAAMGERLRTAAPGGDAVERTLAAVRLAVGVLLEEPEVNRAMMGALGTWSGSPGAVAAQSSALWSVALAEFDGIDAGLVAAARARLPRQLAIMFRGCLSFWVAGEIADAELPVTAEQAAAATLAAFVDPERRKKLLIG